MKIMIVEDSPQMRRTLKRFVSDLATEVYECGDGAEALAVYAAHRPDWVLMDIEMKNTDGLTATRQIKTMFPEAKVMIVTNYDDAELREAARSAGVCEYVVKENLLDVRRILSSHRQSHA